MNLFTILGASGFIGSHLAARFEGEGFRCYCPERDDIPTAYLGDVIDCVGLTADFRTRPFETVEAHVCHLLKILKQCRFDSFLYLSSTRLYLSSAQAYKTRKGIAKEEDVICSQPCKFDDLYNISKMMGESICLMSGRDNVKVVRLSNVYGYDPKSENFIFSLIRDALRNQKVILHTTLDSSKDHISIGDVAKILPEIAIHGKYKIYNVASGVNTTAGQIVNKLAKLTGCSVEVNKDAQGICYPRICVDRIKEEFAFTPTNIIDDLEKLVGKYKEMEGTR